MEFKIIEKHISSEEKKQPTLCLNMIVKNESHIIISTLTNICNKISFDYWVICDTGSTDNTKELIINFFKLKNINGELYENKWIDFGYNRTIALENAYNKTDYLFIFDADDTLEGNFVFPNNIFDYDSYLLNYDKFHSYTRKQLINNRKKWKYIGILHEYIVCLEKDNSFIINGDYYIISGKNGNRNNDVNKYQKDAILLEDAYYEAIKKKDIIYERYSFYCANSYKDANDMDNAIKWYKNTLLLNNWNQEKYISCLNLYYLYDSKKNIENAIFYAIKTYEYDKNRIEGLYNLIKYYYNQNQYDIAFYFYTFIQNYYENDYINDTFDNKLFVDKEFVGPI
jgi:tetratricopeptide (TPR) repeat protein